MACCLIDSYAAASASVLATFSLVDTDTRVSGQRGPVKDNPGVGKIHNKIASRLSSLITHADALELAGMSPLQVEVKIKFNKISLKN